MINHKSYPDQNILCVEHGRITKIHPTEVKALKGELEIQNIYYNNNYYYLKKVDYEAKF